MKNYLITKILSHIKINYIPATIIINNWNKANVINKLKYISTIIYIFYLYTWRIISQTTLLLLMQRSFIFLEIIFSENCNIYIYIFIQYYNN